MSIWSQISNTLNGNKTQNQKEETMQDTTEQEQQLVSFKGEEFEAGKNGNTFLPIAGWTGNPENYKFKYSYNAGKPMFIFSVAVDVGKEDPEWIKVTLWGKRAEEAKEKMYDIPRTGFVRLTGKVHHYECPYTGKIRWQLNANDWKVYKAKKKENPFDSAVFEEDERSTDFEEAPF